MISLAYLTLLNQLMFKHSSRSRPLKLSAKAFYTGRPGRIKLNLMPLRYAHSSMALPVNSGPLSTVITSGVKGGGEVDQEGGLAADLWLSKFSINVLYLVRDGNRCWRRRSCWGSPRRRTLGVDVSPYRLSVNSQLPGHPSN